MWYKYGVAAIASMSGEDYPVSVNEGGIKIKTEKMVKEKLYHCVFENKVFLFYKDEMDLLQCYEVEDPEAAGEIVKNPGEIENILKKHAGT